MRGSGQIGVAGNIGELLPLVAQRVSDGRRDVVGDQQCWQAGPGCAIPQLGDDPADRARRHRALDLDQVANTLLAAAHAQPGRGPVARNTGRRAQGGHIKARPFQGRLGPLKIVAFPFGVHFSVLFNIAERAQILNTKRHMFKF